MVEAAVVLPVMIVFFGVMALAHSSGKAKLAAQHEARSSLLYYASNDCSKRLSTDGNSRAAESGALPAAGGAPSDRLADEAAGGSFEARSSWAMAEGSAQRTATTYGRVHAAKSTSWAVCNESAHDGNLLGLAGYAFDLFGSALPDPIRRAGR